MQIIYQKNSNLESLTLYQKFFIERSIELLDVGSIDSYRVKLHNPLSILEELKNCLEDYNKGKIKHFETIKAKAKDKYSISTECLELLGLEPNYLNFNRLSKQYLQTVLNEMNSGEYLQIISSLSILIAENKREDYLERVIEGLKSLLNNDELNNDELFNKLKRIDVTLNILFSFLVNIGYSKSYLYRNIQNIFIKNFKREDLFDTLFNDFKEKIIDFSKNFIVIFKIDTTTIVHNAISSIEVTGILIKDEINLINFSNQNTENEFNSFNKKEEGRRKFIEFNVAATDHFAALKVARGRMAEYLDVINLGLSNQFLSVYKRVLVINEEEPLLGNFHNNENFFDGKYKVEIELYNEFTKQLSKILNRKEISQDTKDKLKSAIRYLRLGNETTEVEHKFINYWIGLEYLFSNYGSENTIKRLKEHFINAHLRAYVKRNCYSFLKDIDKLPAEDKEKISYTNNEDFKQFLSEDFYSKIKTELMGKYPLIGYRSVKFNKDFKNEAGEFSASEYLDQHGKNLEIHLTRIYRLRSEIIHDAATDTNNEFLASNLRYYLTFILNEIINSLHKEGNNFKTIEEYFMYNKIEIRDIKIQGDKLEKILNIDTSLDFIA